MAKKKVATKRKPSNGCSVTVARLGMEPKIVKLVNNKTVAHALTLAGIEPGAGADVYVNGERSNPRETVSNGDTLVIVTPKAAG
jgi:hypothetical protein